VREQDIPTSGSRWEPTTEPTAEQAPVPADVRATRSPRRLSGRMPVAAAGVGLVLAGAGGGFAIGHAVAGHAVPAGPGTDHGDRPGPDGLRPDGTGPGDEPPDSGGTV
jgi:hypothetical protein